MAKTAPTFIYVPAASIVPFLHPPFYRLDKYHDSQGVFGFVTAFSKTCFDLRPILCVYNRPCGTPPPGYRTHGRPTGARHQD